MERALDMEILNNIRPFSGMPEEMSSGERLISEGKALQKTQTQYTTAVAVQRPRSIAKVTRNVLEEAKLAGAAFYYRWEIKNKKTGRKSVIQGPSIDLAMCIARNYGNCAVDIEGTETPSHYMFKGVFIDLETGFTVPRLFRQRKKQNIGGGYEDDRAEDITFQIGQSKAQRNAITKAAPGWLVDQAIEEARSAEIAKIKPENLHVARGKVLDFFSTYGVTQERMEAKIGRKADQWTAEDLADLRGSATGLKEGRVSPEELFPEIEQGESEQKTQEKPTTNGGGEGSPPPPDDPPPPSSAEKVGPETMDEKALYREEWVNLRSAGYSTFIHKNFKRIEDNGRRWPDLYQEMKEKWAKLYKEPWPLVERVQGNLAPVDQGEKVETIQCPDNDQTIDVSECADCLKKQGCPAHE